LERSRTEWQQQFRAPAQPPPPSVEKEPVDLKLRSEITSPEASDRELPNVGGAAAGVVDAGRLVKSDEALSRQSGRGDGNEQQFQIIGVLGRLYILMENVNGLVLVDQHAAHERILFEELRREMEEQGVPTQTLLFPQTFDLPPRDADWIERNLPTLEKMGIGIESFGPNTFKIDSLPAFLNVLDPVQFLSKVIDDLRSVGNSSSAMRMGEDMIAKTVCRHAVKANDPLGYLEVEKLIRDLLDCDLPYCCPHGRPTMIQISLAELEKKFGRKI
jgi:DNA mismatch repair protein MutL